MSDAASTVHRPARYGFAPVVFADDTAPRPSKGSQLDVADLRIIDSLVADGRANARSMTVITGLSEETVAGRIRSLIDRDIIGVSAILDWRAAGYHWDMFLSISVGAFGADAVIGALAAREEVISIYEVFGPVDLVAHVLCRDRVTMLDFLSTTLPRIQGIAAVDVMPALDTVKYFHQFATVAVGSPPALAHPVIDLTPVDQGIIFAMMRNGRASHREVARELGVADGTIRARLRRLISGGLMRICAQVHPSNSGVVVARAFVGVSAHGVDRVDMATRLARIGEIMTISVTVGRFDLFCYAVARSRSDLVDLIETRIRLTDGVQAVETWEVIEVPKQIARWARW